MTATNEEPVDDFLVNNVIANRYRIDQKLAKGGMATVYRGTDTTLNRVVALKLLHSTKNTDDPGKLTERFRLEAEALARLNHRHIVTIFDYGDTEDGGYYLAMEFVDGPALSQLIRRERLAPERAVRIIIQICKALRYAHKRGIIHRDLKPGNILVGREEDEEIAKLVDFGLVKLTEEESMTQHGLILGTVHCMAPEQIRGGKIDARTDIYAIGIVLFRLLVGQYPYNSKQTAEVLAAHLHAPIPAFSSFDPNLMLPPGLEDVVRKCLQKNPANRYQSATELVQDLAHCLKVPPEQFVSVSLVMKDLDIHDGSSRRNLIAGAIMGFAALLVLSGAAALAMALYGGQAEPDELTGRAPALQAEVLDPQDGEAAPQDEAPPGNQGAAATEEATDPAAEDPDAADEANTEEPAEEPAPEPPAAKAEPAPAPVVRPRPRPRPAPVPAPAPEPEPEPEVADTTPPEPAAPAAATLLNDIAVAQSPERVVITITMSEALQPLYYGQNFNESYHVRFARGGNASGLTQVPVGHPLVDSVRVIEGSNFLELVVRNNGTPNVKFERNGPEYRVVVEP